MQLFKWMLIPTGKTSGRYQSVVAESSLEGRWDVQGPRTQLLAADLERRHSLLSVAPDWE